jgi:hypothetical protein
MSQREFDKIKLVPVNNLISLPDNAIRLALGLVSQADDCGLVIQAAPSPGSTIFGLSRASWYKAAKILIKNGLVEHTAGQWQLMWMQTQFRGEPENNHIKRSNSAHLPPLLHPSDAVFKSNNSKKLVINLKDREILYQTKPSSDYHHSKTFNFAIKIPHQDNE